MSKKSTSEKADLFRTAIVLGTVVLVGVGVAMFLLLVWPA